ncbi:hypothetical protein OIO90_002869 [Microbotryomycetes sp. JL221]|nr:hypothetical protein OIO90_002869 [Microbotryomycetes sp. JL221]
MTFTLAPKQRVAYLDLLPVELLHHTIQYMDPISLEAMSRTSKQTRQLVLDSPSSLDVWRRARERLGFTDTLLTYDSTRAECSLANLIWGKRCRLCGRGNAQRPDFRLRVRLCAKCFDTKLIAEGPDEPDPAFSKYWPGTKRFTPRTTKGGKSRNWRKHRAFFFEPSLERTSEYLESLFEPYLTSEMDEDTFEELWLSPPAKVQAALDARQVWVSTAARDAIVIELYCRLLKTEDPVEDTAAFAQALETGTAAPDDLSSLGNQASMRS